MPMLSFLLACTILWAQVYTTSNCQAIMNINLIVKNRCIGGYSAIINLNHKFIITFRTDVDFNINILKTKFPNSFGFQYFCKTTSYRTRGKYQSLNPTSLWVFTFQTDQLWNWWYGICVIIFFFQNNFNRQHCCYICIRGPRATSFTWVMYSSLNLIL